MEQYFEIGMRQRIKKSEKTRCLFETASLVFDDPLRTQIQTDIPMAKNVGKPLEK